MPGGCRRLTVEHHGAGIRLDQAHQQTGGGRFAAAGFADDAERFALADGEGDVVHRLHRGDLAVEQAAADGEVLAQAFDAAAAAGPGRRGRADPRSCDHLFSLTSIAQRNPSLIRLKHIEVTKIITPGSAAT